MLPIVVIPVAAQLWAAVWAGISIGLVAKTIYDDAKTALEEEAAQQDASSPEEIVNEES